MINNSLILEQQQCISAAQIQSLEILSLSNQELEDYLVKEYLENPMLEHSEEKKGEMIQEIEGMYEKGVSYRDHYIRWQEDDADRTGDIPAKDSDEIENFLLEQLHRNEYKDEEWTLIRYLIRCLDEKGFFIYDPEDVARILDYSSDMVCRCLDILKGLEPAGIFSRDISECLIYQLKKQGIKDEKIFVMINEYMAEILEGHISTVTRKLRLSTAKVKEYIHLIGKLNPRPIMNVKDDDVQYIVPDILVEWENERWKIQLNDNWLGEYKYNDYYIKMMCESNDEELKAYFKQKLERARFVMSCVEQRRSTIVNVVEAILIVQEDYFRNQSSLRPMILEDIAAITGLHISTISRAIRGKYLQYKKPVLLKDLFQGSITENAQNIYISVDDIKKQIQKLVAEEDKKFPLSDQRIQERLKEKGMDVSRRTIAKYRVQMGILDSRQRCFYHSE